MQKEHVGAVQEGGGDERRLDGTKEGFTNIYEI